MIYLDLICIQVQEMRQPEIDMGEFLIQTLAVFIVLPINILG